MDTGSGSSTIPTFDSGFPVDFALVRPPASTDNWNTSARLISEKFVQTNTSSAESSGGNYTFDSNLGWAKGSGNNSSIQSWMWKRHTTGFDVVAYEGTNAAGLQIRHSLGKTPEMIWTKNRDATEYWAVYHKSLNGGTNPEQYGLRLNTGSAEIDSDGWWNDTAPTATAFTVGNSGNTNGFEMSMLAMLFASVDGISSLGGYDGSSSDVTVTTGFQPRFILIKCVTDSYNWVVFDTLRGLTASGNDPTIFLNFDDAQNTNGNHNWITGLSSTGFTVSSPSSYPWINTANEKYIYYAHA